MKYVTKVIEKNTAAKQKQKELEALEELEKEIVNILKEENRRPKSDRDLYGRRKKPIDDDKRDIYGRPKKKIYENRDFYGRQRGVK